MYIYICIHVCKKPAAWDPVLKNNSVSATLEFRVPLENEREHAVVAEFLGLLERS